MKKLLIKSALVLLICALMITVVGCDLFGDTEQPGGDSTHTHSYTEEITKAPTCSAKGEKTFTCSCNDSYTEAIEKLPHTEETLDAKAPTCTESGLTEGKHCSVCNEVLVAQAAVEALGHKNDAVVTAPTCTEGGYTTYTCSVCNDSYVGDKLPALGHTEVVDKGIAATCSEAGKTEGKHCSVCNEVLVAQKPIAALGHTSVIDNAVAPTCTEAGLTEGKHCSVCREVLVAQQTVDALGHTEVIDAAKAPTCTEAGLTEGKHCSACREILVAQQTVDALGHTEIIDAAKAPTCTEAGLTEGAHCSACREILVAQEEIKALGHTEVIDAAKAPTCTEVGLTEGKHCSVCREVLVAQQPIAALGHKYSTEVTAPTCTEGGYTTHTCSVCKDSFVDSKVSALGHSEKTLAAVAPTCTEAGLTEGKKCTACNKVLVAQQTVPAKGHTEKILPAVASTCIETGLTEGKKCTACNKILVAQQTVPAKGHTASNAVNENVIDSTCSKAGSYDSVVYCSVCRVEISRVTKTIDMKPHTEVIDAAVAPTCTEAGLTEGKHCSVCDKVLVAQKTVAALGHTEVTIKGTPVGCKSNGLTDGKQCSVCKEVTLPQQEIVSTGHLDIRTTPATEASCTKEGQTEGKFCAACGDVIAAVATIPKLAHTYDGDSDLTCNVCLQDRDCLHASKELVPGKKATCTETGLTDGYKCKICCDIIVAQDVIPALGHTEIKIPAVAPTCTEAGSTEGVECFICHAILKTPLTINALGHTEKILPAVAATCTATGLTEGKKCSVCDATIIAQSITPMTAHPYSTEWSKDGSYHWHECVCGDKDEKSSHAYSIETARVNATCEKDGYYILECICGAVKSVTIPALDHSYSNAWVETDTQHWHECSSCGSKKDIASHDYNNEIARKDATCTEDGYYTMACVCGDTETYTIKSNGHSLKSVVTAPSCTEQGYTTHTCSVCNYSFKDSQVNALGHTEVIDAAKAPTCTTTGLTEGKHCSVCKTVIIAQEEIKAIGHTPVVDKAVAPTCTTTGITEGKHCSVCNEVLVAQEEVKALGHTEVIDAAKAPT